MFAAVRQYQLVKDLDQNLIDSVQNQFVPIIKGVQGFHAYYLVATGVRTLTTVSVFESQTNAEESSRRAAQWVQQTLAEYIESSPQVQTGEVEVHAEGGS